MGFLISVTVGLIFVGQWWFKKRDRQKKPQPFIVHLIDAVAMLAVMFGWLLAAGLAFVIIFGRV